MGNTDTSIDNLKLVKIIKPYHNGFGRLITPSDDPILNITRYAAETADKLIAVSYTHLTLPTNREV